MMSHRKVLAAAVAMVLGGATSSAWAATGNTTFTVTATVINDCIISSTNIAFANYDPTSATALTATGAVTAKCTKEEAVSVALRESTTRPPGRRRPCLLVRWPAAPITCRITFTSPPAARRNGVQAPWAPMSLPRRPLPASRRRSPHDLRLAAGGRGRAGRRVQRFGDCDRNLLIRRLPGGGPSCTRQRATPSGEIRPCVFTIIWPLDARWRRFY